MAENETVSFKAINVFIERNYLEDLLSRILQAKKNLPKDGQISFNNHFKKFVTVLGFRDPLRAPLQLQINAFASAFEDKEEVVPFTLSTWTIARLAILESQLMFRQCTPRIRMTILTSQHSIRMTLPGFRGCTPRLHSEQDTDS